MAQHLRNVSSYLPAILSPACRIEVFFRGLNKLLLELLVPHIGPFSRRALVMRPVRAEVRDAGLLLFLRFRAPLAFACVCRPEVVPLVVVPHGSDLNQMV